MSTIATPRTRRRPSRQLLRGASLRAAAVGVAVALAVAVAACGSDDDAEAAGAETRSFDTYMGTVEIPADPQRIVSLDSSYTLQVLDEVGASLVGTEAGSDGVWDQLSEEAQELPTIGGSSGADGIDIEAIIALEPDLIIGKANDGGDNEANHEQLSRIAPTVLIDRYIEWADRMRILADAADRSDRAEELIAEVEARVPELEAAIAQRWPDGVQVSLIRVREVIRIETVDGNRDEDVAKSIIRELDPISITGDIREAAGAEDTDVSAEQMREIDADVILYWARGGGGDGVTNDELLAGFLDNPLWDSLSAVEAGRAHVADGEHWHAGYGVTAAHLVIDELQELVADAP